MPLCCSCVDELAASWSCCCGVSGAPSLVTAVALSVHSALVLIVVVVGSLVALSVLLVEWRWMAPTRVC